MKTTRKHVIFPSSPFSSSLIISDILFFIFQFFFKFSLSFFLFVHMHYLLICKYFWRWISFLPDWGEFIESQILKKIFRFLKINQKIRYQNWIVRERLFFNFKYRKLYKMSKRLQNNPYGFVNMHKLAKKSVWFKY